MRTILAIAALTAATSAQLPITTTAHVNDPMSCGSVGDNLLSLEEAIRHMNQEAGIWNAFSATERSLFTWPPCTSPCPPPVERIEIDASVTPVITIEQQFPMLVGDNQWHVCADIVSVNGQCVIDATGTAPGSTAPAVVFPTSTNHFHLSNFIVRGGGTGVINDSAQHFHPGVRMFVRNCVFEGQTVLGIQLTATHPLLVTPQQPGDVVRTVIRNAPVAIEVLDNACCFASNIDIGIRDVTVENCGIGLRIDSQGFNGSVNVTAEDLCITGATDGIRVQRQGVGNGSITLSMKHVNVDATGTALDTLGHVAASTDLTIQHSRLTGATSFSATPSNTNVNIDMVDTVMEGAVVAQTGPVSSVFRIRESYLSDGAVTVAATGGAGTGATPEIFRCRFENAPVTIAASHTKPFLLDDCEFHSSPIQNASAVTVDLDGCFQGASPGTNVGVTNPDPSPWLARAWVAPEKPARGGMVTLHIDLAPDTAALWLLGVPFNSPLIVGTSRYWIDPASPVIGGALPLAGLNALPLPIPRSRALKGKQVYAQPLTLYYHLQRGAFPHPAHIPFLMPRRGGLITIR